MMKGHILKYIEEHKSVKRRELLSHLHSIGVQTSDREMRCEIEQLIVDGFAIASTVKGYKIIRTKEELEDAVKYLKAKAFPLFSRAEKLEHNFNSGKLISQLSLQL